MFSGTARFLWGSAEDFAVMEKTFRGITGALSNCLCSRYTSLPAYCEPALTDQASDKGGIPLCRRP